MTETEERFKLLVDFYMKQQDYITSLHHERLRQISREFWRNMAIVFAVCIIPLIASFLIHIDTEAQTALVVLVEEGE